MPGGSPAPGLLRPAAAIERPLRGGTRLCPLQPQVALALCPRGDPHRGDIHQLRAHGIGTPALEVLRRIPGLRLTVSESECCGVAGTYGLKREKYGVAHAVGAGVLEQVRSAGLDFVITASETCRSG